MLLKPQQLLRRARLDEAARRLRTTAEDIATIAYACGYSDHSAFTRRFRSTLGLSPTAYRAAIGGHGGSSRRSTLS